MSHYHRYVLIISNYVDRCVIPKPTITYGNGTTQTLSFDNASQLTTVINNLAGTAQDLTVSFTYNPAGQIATQVRSNDLYAWTQHYHVDRLYTVNGLNQVTGAGATGVG